MSFYDKVRRQKNLSFSVILFTLAIGVLLGTVMQTGAKAAKDSVVAADATPLVIPSPVMVQSEFAKIAKRLEPSVVNISTQYIPVKKDISQSRPTAPNFRRRGQQQQPDQDDQGGDMQQFMQRFFGGGIGPGGPGGNFQFGEPDDSASAALGSGVVVDRNGYILTNNHVVEKATRITVKFHDDPTEYPATVIGTDKDTDLAVVKVDRKNLVAAKIGNSDALQVGDWVMAIGSPFGFQATVTAGIVSALSRDVPGGEASTFQHFIQTDAAINPGNSGGPLLNINGEVVGINTMIASRSGGYQGIGFAMPINTAAKVYNEIIKQGRVTRGSIGISLEETNESSLKVYGAPHGVLVRTVTPDSPGDKAGIHEQDVITSIGNKPVHKSQDVIDMISESPIGSTVKMGIVRDRKPETLSVMVGDRTKVWASLYGGQTPAESDAAPSATQMKFGMSVQDLRQADKDQAGLKVKGGVMITSVEPGTFAEDVGLQKGDVIVEMNRQAINGRDDVRRIQATLKPGDPVLFHVMRELGGTRGGGDWTSFYPAGKLPETN
ncbi:MAG: Do family serine endopeptidase [Terriglobia bacterium]